MWYWKDVIASGHPEFKQQQIAITLLVCKVTLSDIYIVVCTLNKTHIKF